MFSFFVAFFIAIIEGVLLIYLVGAINRKNSFNSLVILVVKFLLYLLALWIAMAIFPQYLMHFICGFVSAFAGTIGLYFIYRLYLKQYFNIEKFLIKYSKVTFAFLKSKISLIISKIKR